MQFLKDNKRLFYALLLLPLFFFYLDRQIMLWLRDFKVDHPEVNLFLQGIDPIVNLLYNASIIMAFLFIVLKAFFRADLVKTLFYGIITTSIAVQSKHLIGRTRPKLGYDTVFTGPSLKYVYSSFPSGHTTFVFMFSSILSYYYPRYRLLFYGIAVWIGLERIEDNAHFPSDVLGGAILGLLVGRFILYRFAKMSPRVRIDNERILL